ncbi:hypothetical protein V1511DRAFT_500376 [Dipodascopsis uninucleata]
MDKLPAFLKFLSDNKVLVSELITISYSKSLGYHVTISPNKSVPKYIDQDTLLVRVPKDAVLCTSCSVIANLLTDDLVTSIAGIVLSFIFERAVGNRSPWYAYLDMFPARESNCLRYWHKSELEWLSGTDAIDTLNASEMEIKSLYEDIIEPFYKKNKLELTALLGHYHSSEDWTHLTSFNVFADALSIVAARCFEIDAFRGLGLCPVADLFNHSDNNNVAFESLFEVCEYCGDSDYCEHLAHQAREQARAEGNISEGESSDTEPPELEDEWRSDDDPDEDGSENSLSFVSDGESESSSEETNCDVVTCKKIKVKQNGIFGDGQELYNTYGDICSASLLAKYGFAIRGNKHDYLSVERELRAYFRRKQKKWPLGEYPKIDASGRISTSFWNRTVRLMFGDIDVSRNSKSMKTLHLLNTAPSKIPSEASPVIGVILSILEQRRERYEDGNVSSSEYDYLLSTSDDLETSTINNIRKRFAMTILANEKSMLEKALKRCRSALENA